MEDGTFLLPAKISKAGRLTEIVDDSNAIGKHAAKAY